MVAKTKAKKWSKKSSKRAKPKAKGKKRKTFKKVASKTWKKKSFKKRSTRAYRKVSPKLISSAMGDQSILINFVDAATYNNTTNALAKQFVWSTNCVASPAASVGQHSNLMLDAGNHLETMFANVNGFIRTASAYGVPTLTTETLANCKLIRKTAEVQLRIVNAETSNVELWEYRIMAKRDQTILPGAMWYQTSQIEQPGIVSASAGPTIAASAVSGGGYPTQVGVTPFMNHAFCQQYTVLKVKKRELPPGKIWKLKYSLKKPRMYAWNNLCSTVGAPLSYYAGTPVSVPFVVRRGQVLSMFFAKGTYATQGGANAGYTRGISNINLGMEYQYRYHYNFVFGTQASATSVPSVPGFNVTGSQAPLPLMGVVPQLAISTGPVPAAAGTLVYQNNTAPGATSTIDATEV